MAKERGWWTLETTTQLSDVDRDHIARLIVEGYVAGEICEEEEEEEEKEDE